MLADYPKIIGKWRRMRTIWIFYVALNHIADKNIPLLGAIVSLWDIGIN
jgi:hypothetical protein